MCYFYLFYTRYVMCIKITFNNFIKICTMQYVARTLTFFRVLTYVQSIYQKSYIQSYILALPGIRLITCRVYKFWALKECAKLRNSVYRYTAEDLPETLEVSQL